MKHCISDRSLSSLLKLAVTARIASGVIIDMPGLLNAGWIAVLLGAILSLPPLWAIVQCRRSNIRLPRPAVPLLLSLFVFDSASIAGLLADSASYMALNSTYSAYLLLPLLLLCLACLRLNGNAIGSSASFWNRILPWIGLIVVIIQLRDYEPLWLTPFLGPGVRKIAHEAFRIAGWITLPSVLFLITDSAAPEDAALPLRTLPAAALLSAGACVIFGMMTPTIADSTLFTRSFRLGTLLANGRTSLALQIPSITLWYIGLFFTLLLDAFASAALLQRCLPRWNRYACTSVTLIIQFLLSSSGLAGRSASLTASALYYILTCCVIAAVMIIDFLKKGGPSHA